jgi:single-stranded-DNA-specific exonuclease
LDSRAEAARIGEQTATEVTAGVPQRKWRVADELADGIAPDLALWGHPFRQLLYNRGLVTADAVERFLFPEKGEMHDPFEMKGMDTAVDRVFRALREETLIGIYADFDVDGLTAASLLMELLTSPSLQGQVLTFLPDRAKDGYGLNAESIRSLAARGVGLLITVDCGIGADREISLAADLGMSVIVTDHHQVISGTPPATAVLNPHQDGCAYPNRALAGVGVAYKLAEALLSRVWGLQEARRRLEASLDLVALGTVADLAPLTGENRMMVKMGLRELAERKRPGLRALQAVAGSDGRAMDADSISYLFAPRLNAAGRMGDAGRALALLTCRSDAEATGLALELEAANKDRQALTSSAVETARARISQLSSLPAVLVLAGDFPAPVAGLVASRLVEEYRRPAFVIEQGTPESRGSARSLAGFDVTAALASASDLLGRFGGHSQAAGFALSTDLIPLLESRLQDAASAHTGSEAIEDELFVDAVLPLRQIGPALHQDLQLLEPCGSGNRRPVFCSRRLIVRDARVVGNRHLKLWLQDDNGTCSAIGFGMATDEYAFVRSGARVDCAYTIARNERAGTVGYEMVLRDVRPWRNEL